MSSTLGSGTGPLGFAWFRDTLGNYDGALRVASLVLVAAAASFLLLGRYRFAPARA